MSRFLGRYADVLYSVLRVVAGLLFAVHGTQKLFGFPAIGPSPLPPLMAAAGLIELVGGLMVAFGVFASWAAFIASGEMAAAYFLAHAPRGFWPLLNRGEVVVLFCFIFLYVAARGGGRWSLTRD
jgi:putative oxidoreductase